MLVLCSNLRATCRHRQGWRRRPCEPWARLGLGGQPAPVRITDRLPRSCPPSGSPPRRLLACSPHCRSSALCTAGGSWAATWAATQRAAPLAPRSRSAHLHRLVVLGAARLLAAGAQEHLAKAALAQAPPRGVHRRVGHLDLQAAAGGSAPGGRAADEGSGRGGCGGGGCYAGATAQRPVEACPAHWPCTQPPETGLWLAGRARQAAGQGASGRRHKRRRPLFDAAGPPRAAWRGTAPWEGELAHRPYRQAWLLATSRPLRAQPLLPSSFLQRHGWGSGRVTGWPLGSVRSSGGRGCPRRALERLPRAGSSYRHRHSPPRLACGRRPCMGAGCDRRAAGRLSLGRA